MSNHDLYSPTIFEFKRNLTAAVEEQFEKFAETGSSWDENGLSQELSRILLSLGTFKFKEPKSSHGYNAGEVHTLIPIEIQDSEKRILAFKARNALEKRHGDICLIIDIATEDYHFQGVAYFEAKLCDEDWKIPNADLKQFSRILGNTAYPYLLLYHSYKYRIPSSFGIPEPTSLTVTPLQLMTIAPSAVSSLVMEAFINHLVFRSFRGFELDTRKTALKEAFDLGARYYLHARLGKARTLEKAIELAKTIPEIKIPQTVLDMHAHIKRRGDNAQHREIERYDKEFKKKDDGLSR